MEATCAAPAGRVYRDLKERGWRKEKRMRRNMHKRRNNRKRRKTKNT